MDKHQAFKEAYAEYPSQDQEGYIPHRGDFKSGFFAGWAARESSDEHSSKLGSAMSDAQQERAYTQCVHGNWTDQCLRCASKESKV